MNRECDCQPAEPAQVSRGEDRGTPRGEGLLSPKSGSQGMAGGSFHLGEQNLLSAHQGVIINAAAERPWSSAQS